MSKVECDNLLTKSHGKNCEMFIGMQNRELQGTDRSIPNKSDVKNIVKKLTHTPVLERGSIKNQRRLVNGLLVGKYIPAAKAWDVESQKPRPGNQKGTAQTTNCKVCIGEMGMKESG